MKIFGYPKRLLLALIILTQATVLASCAPQAELQQTPPDELQQQEYPRGTFHYEYGQSLGVHGEFWIWEENGDTYFECSVYERDKSVDACAKVDAEVFDALSEVISDNRIDLWNGFSKSDINVLDGHGFSMDMEYRDVSIHADGYMYEPKNYQSGHDALLAFLCEYAEGLPVTPPYAYSVGYIIVGAGEFRFDMILGMYNSSYSQVESVHVRTTLMDSLDERNYYSFRRTPGSQTNEHERYAEFDFEPAKEIRERALTLELSNGWPGRDVSEYAVISYPGRKISGDHLCHAVLSDEEQKWFTEKIKSVIGVSADFDFTTLFDIE